MIKIDNNNFFQDSMKNIDLDELLDLRDVEVFESEWIRVYDNLAEVVLETNQKKEVDEIRKLSFIKAYNMFESSDIAACISDDFELICKAYISGYEDNWLNSLIMSYVRGEFPCGELCVVKINANDCFNYFLQ